MFIKKTHYCGNSILAVLYTNFQFHYNWGNIHFLELLYSKCGAKPWKHEKEPTNHQVRVYQGLNRGVKSFVARSRTGYLVTRSYLNTFNLEYFPEVFELAEENFSKIIFDFSEINLKKQVNITSKEDNITINLVDHVLKVK